MTAETIRNSEISHPRRRADVVRRETSSETLLYDPRADAIHVLNQTALAVWDLCDGKHTATDIGAELRSSFAVHASSDIAGDVGRVLDRFQREQLLETSAGDR